MIMRKVGGGKFREGGEDDEGVKTNGDAQETMLRGNV